MMRETLSGTILSIKFHLTLSSSQHQILLLCRILYFSERKEENAEIAEDAPAAEGPAPAAEGPTPAPAPTVDIVHKQPHTPGTRKSTKNFGRPASAYSAYTDTISTWISGYPVQCWTL